MLLQGNRGFLQEENVEDYFPIPFRRVVPNSEVFMLHVRGESMINVGILDGDNVLVQQQSTAKDGEMVVALVEDSATVKTFYKEDGYIRLQPENDTMEPIIVPDCQILGKVFGIFRFLRIEYQKTADIQVIVFISAVPSFNYLI